MIIAHIAVSVSNIKKSAEFYCKHFGFRRAQEFRIAALGLTICMLKNKAAALELFEFKKRRSLPGYRKNLDSDLKTVGVKHFAFAAKNIVHTYNTLKKSRVRFATGMRSFEDGSRYFFIKDPDGILVEIMEAR